MSRIRLLLLPLVLGPAIITLPSPAAEGAFQGANGTIAFARDEGGLAGGDIYAISAGGTGETRLTSSGLDSRPAWSPDGRRIAFERFPAEVWVMNGDGSGQTMVTNGSDPAWSPDGRRLAFEREGAIHVINADGSGTATNLTPDSALNHAPAWSPDGAQIAFSSFRDSIRHLTNREIYVMDADGSDQTRLTTTPALEEAPDWSPDGSRIVFESDGDIAVVNAGGGAVAKITSDAGQDRSPTWSPDGQKIAFARNLAGNDEIFVVNANGSDATRVTVNAATDGSPSWQRQPGGTIPIKEVSPPERLVVAGVQFKPAVLRSRAPFSARILVKDTRGFRVQGALVSLRSVSRRLLRPVAQKSTAARGVATFRLKPTILLPLGNRRLTIVVRARKQGEAVSGGVSARRVVTVSLRPRR